MIIISNTKHTHLGEPFLASDWSYFTEALRYPSLYLPFFGKLKATLLLGTFVWILLLWLWLEPAWSEHISALMIVGIVCILLGAASIRWACTSWPASSRSFDYDAQADVTQWGIFASLALYGHELKKSPISVQSPFLPLQGPEPHALPHFIAIQAESFFDLHRHFSGHLSTYRLVNWEVLKNEALAHGPLFVPAWGANTVRTELTFLTGLSPSQLGVHRFQPYATALKTTALPLASYLQGFGYETIFVHPYLKRFYNRHRVMLQLGFDSFVDLTSFDEPASSEKYVSDLAVGKTLVSLLNKAHGPIFLHAVTVAGHGPYALKGAKPG